MSDPLVVENEALHALLADACAVLDYIAGHDGYDMLALASAAQACLDRVRDGEPMWHG